MTNAYTYIGPGTRWTQGDATAEDYMNVARVNADHVYTALNTIMNTSLADGILRPSGGLDLDGQDLVIDADADSLLHATADDVVELRVAGAAVVQVGAGNIEIYTPYLCHYRAVNDGNPYWNLGSSATERGFVAVNYSGGTQTVASMSIGTYTASGTANMGQLYFYVDEVLQLTINDGGMNGTLGGTTPAAGTFTTVTCATLNASSATISSNASTLSFDTTAAIDTSGNNALTLNTGTAALTVTAGDVTIYDNNNNADTSLSIGTSGTERLLIEVLNGAANKTAESVNIVSQTASGTANMGQITIGVDDVTIVTINDSGLNATIGATTAAAGSFTTVTCATLNATSATISSNASTLSFDTSATIDVSGNNVLTLNTGTGYVLVTGSALHIRDDRNDAAPSISMGPNDNDKAAIIPYSYAGTKVLQGLNIGTSTTSATANAGTISMIVDDAYIAQFIDTGMDLGDRTLYAGTVYFVSPAALNTATTTISCNATTWSFDAGVTIDTSGNNILTLNSGTAALAVTAGDVNIYDDNNNADVTLSIGTSATERLYVIVNNGAANKTCESAIIGTYTESATANMGQIVVSVDGTYIATFRDDGMYCDLATFAITTGAGQTLNINATTTGIIQLTADYVFLLDATTDASPYLNIGSSFNERVLIQAAYKAGTNQVSHMQIGTFTELADAHAGQWYCYVDGAVAMMLDDNGIQGQIGLTNAYQGNFSRVFIGDTADTNVSVGLTINQGANDDGILSFKSSDVAHSTTTYAETDTYALFLKNIAANGGLLIRGFSDGDAAGMNLVAHVGVADPTDTTAAFAVTGCKWNSSTGSQAMGNAELVFQVVNYSTAVLNINGGGTVFLGDTTNANMTQGLTVNQGASDDEVVALKSSDVAHGRTTLAETDTYGTMAKSSATGGGLQITGYSDTDITTGNCSLWLRGFTADAAADTTHTTAGVGLVTVDAAIGSGTTVQIPGSNENLLVVRAYTTTRFIVDCEGDIFYDGTASAYDSYDDVALVRAFGLTQRDAVRGRFDAFVRYNEGDLVAAGIMGAPRSEGGLICLTRLTELHTGAIWQLGTKAMEHDERMARLELAVAAREIEIAELRAQLAERNN